MSLNPELQPIGMPGSTYRRPTAWLAVRTSRCGGCAG